MNIQQWKYTWKSSMKQTYRTKKEPEDEEQQQQEEQEQEPLP